MHEAKSWIMSDAPAKGRPAIEDGIAEKGRQLGGVPERPLVLLHILAYLYSQLAPEFSDIFLTDARNIAHSREIIGVHYPSDSEAGRIFARQFVDALLQNDMFKTEFAKVREEWSRVRTESAD